MSKHVKISPEEAADRLAIRELVEAYAHTLTAPKKQLIRFENSSHFPFYEQSDDFNRTMVEVVKANTYP